MLPRVEALGLRQQGTVAQASGSPGEATGQNPKDRKEKTAMQEPAGHGGVGAGKLVRDDEELTDHTVH